MAEGMVTRAGPGGGPPHQQPAGGAEPTAAHPRLGGVRKVARLTEAFNLMLRALAESRERQARSWLPTPDMNCVPLTSLRTNVGNS